MINDGLIIALCALACLCLCGVSLHAEIHEHEVRRLIYLTTSCGFVSLTPLVTEGPTRRYKSDCRDASAYPDGITILCTDVNDDRSCKVETPPRNFENLRLLHPNSGTQK